MSKKSNERKKVIEKRKIDRNKERGAIPVNKKDVIIEDWKKFKEGKKAFYHFEWLNKIYLE